MKRSSFRLDQSLEDFVFVAALLLNTPSRACCCRLNHSGRGLPMKSPDGCLSSRHIVLVQIPRI